MITKLRIPRSFRSIITARLRLRFNSRPKLTASSAVVNWRGLPMATPYTVYGYQHDQDASAEWLTI
ncbi:hypothetical protein [Vibrio diazotrophicus]|uniref:hypothetical protein n=1 Tax=Vibrio diazotrophicus TaxID=685 RepID=UPI0011BF68E1|nr:hypothetical protein [Vibrio diazotrophicus]